MVIQLKTRLDGEAVDAGNVGKICERKIRLAGEKFGKGRHPAGLNFGDCLSYGAARYYRSTLLFKGDDLKKYPLEVSCIFQEG